MQQNTDEWYAARLGKLTASRFADATARTKSGWGASRDTYMTQLAMERLTGIAHRGYVSDAMEAGTAMEEQAFNTYSFVQGEAVERLGFIPHPTIQNCGASPDGLTRSRRLVELKCPLPHTHFNYIFAAMSPRRQLVPGKYRKQIALQMICCGVEECDWVSYCPGDGDIVLPPNLHMVTERVHISEFNVREIEDEARQFLAELDERVEQLRRFGT